MPSKNTSETGIRRAYVLRVESDYLSKQIEALALILQGQSYNRGFNAGFDYAATGTASIEKDPETGETVKRTLLPAGEAA